MNAQPKTLADIMDGAVEAAAPLALPAPAKPKADAEFDWSDRADVVQVELPTVAVYENPDGCAVIRKRQEWNDEADTFIVIGLQTIPDLIDRLRAIYDGR